MKTLLHIPHASLSVPDGFYDGLLIPREEFRRYNLKMSDVGVDELFRDVRGERVRSATQGFSAMLSDSATMKRK